MITSITHHELRDTVSKTYLFIGLLTNQWSDGPEVEQESCCDNCAARALTEAEALGHVPLTPSRTSRRVATLHASSDSFSLPSVHALLSPSARLNSPSHTIIPATPPRQKCKQPEGDPLKTLSKWHHMNPTAEDTPASPKLAAVRHGKQLYAAVEALEAWRHKTILSSRYTTFPITEHGLLMDDQLRKIVNDATLCTPDDINHLVCKPPWVLVKWHGQEVLDVLREVNKGFRETKQVAASPKRHQSRKCPASCRRAFPRHSTCFIRHAVSMFYLRTL